MLDIKSFLKAQKVMWAKRLLTPDMASWKAVPRKLLETQLGLDIFKCSMICTKKPAGFPSFYWQILGSWFELKSLIELKPSPNSIRKECKWLNKNIKLNKKVLFWKDWHIAGINIIHDIIHEDGKFLSIEELNHKYNIPCNFFKYNRLKDAIPKEWRQLIRTSRAASGDFSFEDPIFIVINKYPKSIKLVTNKDIYWIFIKQKQQEAIIINKLRKTLGIKNDEWDEIFLIPKAVRNTKVQSFQYKVLFNLIPCNLYLKRIKKSDTDKCDQCGELDDILHYFWECNQNQIFWTRFKAWWQGMMEEHVQIDKKTVLVGCTGKVENMKVLNACILIAKWHIYKNKLNNDLIFFYKYLCELKYAIKIEKNIAMRNNQLREYNVIWQKIEDYIT
jgi:hypothetical protein